MPSWLIVVQSAGAILTFAAAVLNLAAAIRNR